MAGGRTVVTYPLQIVQSVVYKTGQSTMACFGKVRLLAPRWPLRPGHSGLVRVATRLLAAARLS